MESEEIQTVSKPVNHQVTVSADIQLLSCGRGIKSGEYADKSNESQTNTRV